MSTFLTLNRVRSLLDEYGLAAKKKYGQNFLVEGNILNRIVDSLPSPNIDYIVEIGAGLGSLTQALADKGYQVLAVEVDTDFCPLLAAAFAGYDNAKFKFTDILAEDIEKLLPEAFSLPEIPAYQVCANIPYHITSPIIFKLLQECPHMQSATLMMQREVAERILAVPGNKNYGRLTVNCNYHAASRCLFKVSRNCFFPRPEVDSAMLQLIPYHQNKPLTVIEEAIFHSLIHHAFQKRRKTVLNITSEFFNCSKVKAETILTALGIKSNLRPENLSVAQWVNLTDAFAQN